MRADRGDIRQSRHRLHKGPSGGHSGPAGLLKRNRNKEAPMRIALAEFKQETNTFVPFTTTVKTFEEQYLYRGDEMLSAFGKARLEIPGALDDVRGAGAKAVPLLATMAMAS